jgi:signal transduction histidine kinase
MALRDEASRIYANVSVKREQLAQREVVLQALTRRMVELQERERYDVTNQLYNHEGQRQSALMRNLGRLQRYEHCDPALAAQLAEMSALVDGILQDIHTLAVTLRPASPDRLGVGSAPRQYALDFGRKYGLDIKTELTRCFEE